MKYNRKSRKNPHFIWKCDLFHIFKKALSQCEGILIFKIRNKRKVKQFTDLEDAKSKLINIEKNKILKMYSMSHYDNLKRSIPINYY